MSWRILEGNALDTLKTLADNSVHCIVTSPPYWGLRKYDGVKPSIWGGKKTCKHKWATTKTVNEYRRGAGMEKLSKRYRGGGKKYPAKRVSITRGTCIYCGAWRGFLGLEPTPEMWLKHLVLIFRECHRVLRKDGTMWVNVGDNYAGAGYGPKRQQPHMDGRKYDSYLAKGRVASPKGSRVPTRRDRHVAGLKPKDLVGQPWMLAFALRDQLGFYLRSEIIWWKPNPMPDSVKDRPTKAHEQIFLFSKSRRYYFDRAAFMEDTTGNAHARGSGVGRKIATPAGWDTRAGHGGNHAGIPEGRYVNKNRENGFPRSRQNQSFSSAVTEVVDKRNRRTVWEIPTTPFNGNDYLPKELRIFTNDEGEEQKRDHFAVFPLELARLCVETGCPVGGTALDPFSGSGTVGVVATRNQRDYIGCEASPIYVVMQQNRIVDDAPLFNQPDTPASSSSEPAAQAMFPGLLSTEGEAATP